MSTNPPMIRVLACCLAMLSAACGPTPTAAFPQGIPVLRPTARAQTEPVRERGDAADDPAIWVHPTDPALSLVIGTNKKNGIEVYALDGRRLSIASAGLEPDNVDVAYDVELGDRKVDVAVAAVRGSQHGLMMWTIDAAQRTLVPALDAAVPVFGGGLPYGSTTYRRAQDGQLFVFVNDKQGHVEQHLVDGRSGRFVLTAVRAFDVGGQTEGCVADDEYGRFYIAEEKRAIWCYGAEPDDPAGHADRTAVDLIPGQSGAVADIEGLTLYCARDGHGCLLASIQGADRFHVYDREGDHRLLAIVDPAASASIGDVSETDGIAVESFGLGAPFERGLFVAHDGDNAPANQDFKLYAWPDVAGATLLVDPAHDPRRPIWRRHD